MARLKVLFVCSWYPNRDDAFIGNFIQRHAMAAALYVDVYTLSAHAAEAAEIVEDESVQVKETRVYFKKRVPLLSYRKALRKGYRHLTKHYGNFDLVHTHVAYPAAILANRLSLPSLVSEHFSGYHAVSGHQWSATAKSIAQKALKQAHCVLPVSDHLGAAIRRFEPAARTQKLSNVVDTKIFKLAPELRNSDSDCHFLHVSTLEERSKNISGLLKAFKELQDQQIPFHLTIGGDGDIEKLKKDIAAVGMKETQITVFGATNSLGIAKLMQTTDCFLLTSNFENQPCVILEALCCGTPVISSEVGGISEEVDAQNGLLYPAGNHEELLNTLSHFCSKKKSFNHQEIAEKAQGLYSLEAVGKKLYDIYTSALK